MGQYFSKKTQEYKKEIKVKPLKIVNFEGFWYLIALDVRNDKLKKYHPKSISNIRLLDIIFTINKDLDELLENSINIWFDSNIKPFEVILYLNKYAAKILKRKPISKSQRVISEYKDGSCDISLMITDAREITSIIKYWIPHVKVVSPKAIGKSIMKDIQKFIS